MANSIIGRVAVSHNTQFATVDTVSPEVVLTVGNNDGFKAVVRELQNDPMFQVTLYIPQYKCHVYKYLIDKNSLVCDVVMEIHKMFKYLEEILDYKSVIEDAAEFGLQCELISLTLMNMLDGESVNSAIQQACWELDL